MPNIAMKTDLFRLFSRRQDCEQTTIWGRFRAFDGIHLALFALDENAKGAELFTETLDLIETSLHRELTGEGDQWHLGDFALHTVWRAMESFPDQIPADLRKRAEKILTGYVYHCGGMSENHDLLHASMRLLVAERFPEAKFRDGRHVKDHRPEARDAVLEWFQVYLNQGSHEWGSSVYETVNLLSFCNFFDGAGDREVRREAGKALDFLAREMAFQAMAGATAGAARRDYGCYRLSTQLNPSRPVHSLWFGTPLPAEPTDFAGGTLVAALSEYRPSAETVALARSPGPLCSSDWNTCPYWMPGVEVPESFRVTTRLPGVQLSGTVIPASPSRYTDWTWTAVFDETAVIFANHPAPAAGTHQGAERMDVADLLNEYERPHPPHKGFGGHVPGNMPPGMPGDLRPGFWQGHGAAPACWMKGRHLLCLFSLPEDAALPWIHFYFPVKEFDDVRTAGHWIFARKGEGRIRIWTSTPAVPVRKGVWADQEWRCHGRRTAMAIEIHSGTGGSDWRSPDSGPQPVWDPETPSVSWSCCGETVTLTPEGASPESVLPPRQRSVRLDDPVDLR